MHGPLNIPERTIPRTTYLPAIDVLRIVAIVSVIFVHTKPFKGWDGPRGELAFILCNQFIRFAVPFFLMTSGYFWARRVERDELTRATLRILRRVFPLWLVWSLIYLLPYNAIDLALNGTSAWLEHWHEWLAEWFGKSGRWFWVGGKNHLWFMMSLMQAAVVAALCLRWGGMRLLWIVAVILYAVGLLAKAYARTPLGIDWVFNTRNGPFMATLMFATGMALARCTPRRTWLGWGLALWLGGTALHFAELWALVEYTGVRARQDFVIGTWAMGLGFTLIGLANPPALRIAWIARLGKWTLGLYAAHFLFIDLFKPLAPRFIPEAWVWLYPALATAATFALVAAMARWRWTRWLVS